MSEVPSCPAILTPFASRLTSLGIDILLEPFERQRAADAALDGEIVDQLRHRGELDAVAGAAVVAPAVPAVGEDRDLFFIVPAGIFSRYQVGDLGGIFEQLIVRRDVQRIFFRAAVQRIIAAVQPVEDDDSIGAAAAGLSPSSAN